MQGLNKKGISEAIITFTLTAIGIVAAAFMFYSLNLLFTLDVQASPIFNCLEADISNPITLRNACVNQEGEIEALVQRNPYKAQIHSLTFTLEDETWRCEESCGNCQVLPEGISRKYYLSPDQNPLDKQLTLYIETCEINTKVITPC